MVYDAGDSGVYLFLYRSVDDGPGFADYWFESIADAVRSAEQEFGVQPDEWIQVPDPQPGCQHDWIAPMLDNRDCDK
jgi:biofilm protein TabA